MCRICSTCLYCWLVERANAQQLVEQRLYCYNLFGSVCNFGLIGLTELYIFKYRVLPRQNLILPVPIICVVVLWSRLTVFVVFCADSPEDTCTVLQTVALSLEEMVEGSFCQVRDDDQDSCNDCLWLNCTAAISSFLGTLFVSFHSRFLPCYAYNASEGIDIHASNSSLFAGTDQFLVSVFADRTASVEDAISKLL